MHHTKILMTALLATSMTSVTTAIAAGPNDYPSKPVTIVVPFAPGGATDIIGRLVADELGKRWKQSVIVENKPGAGGNIGTANVARAQPDGYTLLLGTQTALAVNPTLMKSVGYDPLKDFTPISLIASTPLLLIASNQSGVTSVQDLVQMLKAKPGAYSYGSSGMGTSQHLTAEIFLKQAGVNATHIPYKGSSQSLTDLVSGQFLMQFDNMATAMTFAKAGRVKALAVTTASRSELAPEVPTLDESGLSGFEASTWLGMLAPAMLPAPLLAHLNEELIAVLNNPAVKAKLGAQGFTVRPMKPEAFQKFMHDETAKFATVIKQANISVD
jgi:tripartite-type tricarboxylate transporter receptor subunit TctC